MKMFPRATTAVSMLLVGSLAYGQSIPSPRSDLDGSPGAHNFGVIGALTQDRAAEIQEWLAWGIEVGLLTSDATTKDARRLRQKCRQTLRAARIVEGVCYYTDGALTVATDRSARPLVP